MEDINSINLNGVLMLIDLNESNELHRVTVVNKVDDTVIVNIQKDESGDYKGIAINGVEVEIIKKTHRSE